MSSIQQRDSQAFWIKVITIAAIYVFIQFAVLLMTGEGWRKFFHINHELRQSYQYWDASHYAALALKPACSAFYPLWPSLVNWIFKPSTSEQALKILTLFSEGLFIASLPLALKAFEKIIEDKSIALLAFALYSLGPNAVFYSIGYTESLFALISLLLLFVINQNESESKSFNYRLQIIAVFFLSIALNLTRPVLIQSIFAVFFALLLSFLTSRNSSINKIINIRKRLVVAVSITTGSLLGYLAYGSFCLQNVGNLFGPFQAQIEWGRTFAVRPMLLLLPRSLLIDLHGLYGAALIFFAIAFFTCLIAKEEHEGFFYLAKDPKWNLLLIHPLVFTCVLIWLSRQKESLASREHFKIDRKSSKKIFSFCILFSVAFSGIHSIINFLLNSGYLYSTSRHYFGSPFAFVGMGCILSALGSRRLNSLMWIIVCVGIILLGVQWFNFSFGSWLG